MFKPIDTFGMCNLAVQYAADEVHRHTKRAEFYKQISDVAQEFYDDGLPGILDDVPDEQREVSKHNITVNAAYGGVIINVHLSEGQSISMVKPLLAKLARTRLFGPASFRQFTVGTVVRWEFMTKDTYMDSDYDTYRCVLVDVVYADSQVCTMQETGKMVPEMKLVCSDGNVFDRPTEDTAKLAEEGVE